MLEQQNAGSKGFYGRQYVGPQDTHPGAQQPATQAVASNPNNYVSHQAGPAAGPSNYNATATGPTNQNAANYARPQGLAGTPVKQPRY